MTNTTDNNARFGIDLGGENNSVNLDNIILREHKIVKTIVVTSPKNNDVWKINRSYDITWTSSDINKINIYYKLANQSSWTDIASNIGATLGKYSWTVPASLSDSCQIKLEDAEDVSINAVSPKFYIVVPSVEIIFPKEGETLHSSEKYQVEWKSQFVDKINLFYKSGNSSSWIKFGNNIDASILKYSWTIPDAVNDSCQIKAEDFQYSTISFISPKFYINRLTDVTESIASSGSVLFRISPNPFNQITTIEFTIPTTISFWKGNEKGVLVTLKVYNSFGSEVVPLVDEYKPAGNYQVQFDGSRLVNGIYLCKLTIGTFSQTKKLVLMNR